MQYAPTIEIVVSGLHSNTLHSSLYTQPHRRTFARLMQSTDLVLPHWGWFLLAIGVGIVLAALAYNDRQPWSRPFRTGIAANRFVIGVLLALGISPLALRRIQTLEEPASVALLVDDSRSVSTFLGKNRAAFIQELARQQARLKEAGIRSEIIGFSGDSLAFNRATTDVDELLTRQRRSALARTSRQLVLLSDGLTNRGPDLSEISTEPPLFTVGLGDTVPQRDNRIIRISTNAQVQQESRFPVRVEMRSQGYRTPAFELTLEMDGRTVQRQTVNLPPGGGYRQVTYMLDAGKAGVRNLAARISPSPGEVDLANNQAAAKVVLSDLRTRILIAAAAPHPDVKAIRTALERVENLDVIVWPGFGNQPKGTFQAVVLHRFPDERINMPTWLQTVVATTPAWFIYAQGTSAAAFNAINGLATVQQAGDQVDDVNGALNTAFSKFSVADVKQPILDALPGLIVPYGSVSARGEAEAMMQQTIGTASNGKPLWLLGRGGARRQAVLLGEGIWQWRLQEGVATEAATNTDLLVQRTVQWLAAGESGRRFIFRPERLLVQEGEALPLRLQVLDEAGNPLNGQSIEATFQRKGGALRRESFSYSPTYPTAALAGLEPGVYAYSARTQVGKEDFATKGTFTVEPNNAESIVEGAQWGRLRRAAIANRGLFLTQSQLPTLADTLLKYKPVPVLLSNTRYQPLREWWPYLWLLVGLFTLEWIARRWQGGV